MDLTGIIYLVVGVLMAIGLSLAVRYFLHERRLKLHESGTRFVLNRDPVEAGENDQDASFSSEQIEEMVKAKLAAYPDLLGTQFDFRTTAGGMLEIIFGERSYQDVEQIPDERVRKAITEAVTEFNRE